MRRYQALVCWQVANELKEEVYALVDESPVRYDRKFCDQIKDSAVIVFPTDAKKMKYPQRYVRVTRPAPDGRFAVPGLPPGDYSAIALEHYSPGPTPSADFLERQRPHATSVTLLDGETRTVDLRVNSAS